MVERFIESDHGAIELPIALAKPAHMIDERLLKTVRVVGCVKQRLWRVKDRLGFRALGRVREISGQMALAGSSRRSRRGAFNLGTAAIGLSLFCSTSADLAVFGDGWCAKPTDDRVQRNLNLPFKVGLPLTPNPRSDGDFRPIYMSFDRGGALRCAIKLVR